MKTVTDIIKVFVSDVTRKFKNPVYINAVVERGPSSGSVITLSAVEDGNSENVYVSEPKQTIDCAEDAKNELFTFGFSIFEDMRAMKAAQNC